MASYYYHYCYNCYYYCRFYTITGSDLASDTRLQHNVDYFAYYGELRS